MKTKNSKTFRIASVNDVHLGSRRVPTSFKINNLRNTINDELIASLDVLFVSGDFFDRLLDMSQPEGREIADYIHDLLTRCAKHNTAVRVLEGTPSHDYGQNSWFTTIQGIGKIPVDLEYIDTPAIETLPDSGFTVLYIPDKFRLDANDTWSYVRDLLKDKGLTKVDYACMHGQFEHQLPIESISSHKADNYLGIVDKHIFIGHIHNHSVLSRIIAPGSFDRDTHGQEEAKGLSVMEYNLETHELTHEFIENKGARVFKRFNTEGYTQEQYRELSKTLDYPPGSFIELEGRDTDIIKDVLPEFMRLHPDYVFTTKILKDKDELAKITLELETIDIKVIDQSNITDIVLDKLKQSESGVDQVMYDRVNRIMQELVNGTSTR